MPDSKELARKRRSEQFVKTQAALPEDQRLENLSDLALPSERVFALGTIDRHDSARRWFQEFMEDCQPDLYDPKYFETHGSPLYKPETFKAYAVYLSRSRRGLINDKPTVRTILDILATLFTQIERKRRCQMLKADKQDVKNFVENDLKNQEGLTTAILDKPLALANDTSYILSVLCSTTYLATFTNMRIVLNMALYINLMIDAAGRGGDMLFTPGKHQHKKYFSSSSTQANLVH